MFHSMRSKILAAVIGVTILAGLFITVLFYWKSSKMIEENYKENLYARIEQTGEAFDHSLSEIYHMTVQAACDEKLLEKMETYLAGEEETQLEELSQMLREYETQCTDITSVYLVFPQKQMIITSKEYPIYEKKVAQWKLNEIEKLSQNAITPAMIQNPIGKKSDILSFVNSIEDSTGNTIAYIMSNMEEQVLYYKYLDSLEDEKTSKAVIVDKDFSVVSTKEQKKVGNSYQEVDIQKEYEKEELKTKNSKVIRVIYRTEFTGCYFFLETEKGKVLADLREFRNFLTLILIAVSFTALIPAIFITRAMYRPLKNLTKTMGLVGEGELNQRVEIVTKDEIGVLSEKFNRMLGQIEELIEQLVKEEMLKKDAELEALQYQITPHFMYNTLNSIKYAALLKGEKEIGNFIEEFVELLQASINKKGIFVTVAEEVHFVKNYMNLQNMHYEDEVMVSYDISLEAQGCFLPRLMLQPLVENAIFHGLNIKNGNSQIMISGKVEQDTLYLTVADNGRGMSKEQIEELLAVKEKKTRGLSGIGIANVRERLELYYGTLSGITYESSEQGTKACIYLPAYKEQNQYALS